MKKYVHIGICVIMLLGLTACSQTKIAQSNANPSNTPSPLDANTEEYAKIPQGDDTNKTDDTKIQPTPVLENSKETDKIVSSNSPAADTGAKNDLSNDLEIAKDLENRKDTEAAKDKETAKDTEVKTDTKKDHEGTNNKNTQIESETKHEAEIKQETVTKQETETKTNTDNNTDTEDRSDTKIDNDTKTNTETVKGHEEKEVPGTIAPEDSNIDVKQPPIVTAENKENNLTTGTESSSELVLTQIPQPSQKEEFKVPQLYIVYKEDVSNRNIHTVYILDESLEVIKQLENAICKTDFQKADCESLIELGISKNETEQTISNKNCYGAYSVKKGDFIIPPEYASIQYMENRRYIKAVRQENVAGISSSYVDLYDESGKRLFENIYEQDGYGFFEVENYFWLISTEGNIKIYDSNLKELIVIPITGSCDVLYGANGSISLKKTDIFEKLGMQDTSENQFEFVTTEAAPYYSYRASDQKIFKCYINHITYLFNDTLDVLAKNENDIFTVYKDRYSLKENGKVQFYDAFGKQTEEKLNHMNGSMNLCYDGKKFQLYEDKTKHMIYLYQNSKQQSVFEDAYYSKADNQAADGYLMIQTKSEELLPSYPIYIMDKEGKIVSQFNLEGYEHSVCFDNYVFVRTENMYYIVDYKGKIIKEWKAE